MNLFNVPDYVLYGLDVPEENKEVAGSVASPAKSKKVPADKYEDKPDLLKLLNTRVPKKTKKEEIQENLKEISSILSAPKMGDTTNYGIRVKDISLPFVPIPLREPDLLPKKHITEKAPFPPKIDEPVHAEISSMSYKLIYLVDKLPFDRGTTTLIGTNIILEYSHNCGDRPAYKYSFVEGGNPSSNTDGYDVVKNLKVIVVPLPEAPPSYNELYGDGNKRDYIKEQRKEYNIFDVISIGYKLITAIIALSKEYETPKPPKVKWVQAGDYKLLERWEIV